MADAGNLTSGKTVILEKQIADLVKKAPVLPANAKDTFVKLLPWLDLVLLIISLPAVLAVLALGSLVGGVATSVGVSTGPLYWLALVFLVVQVVLMGLALPGLFKQSRSGWVLLYYGSLLSVVYNLVHWINSPAAFFGLVWSLAVSAVSLWLIFQVRNHYK